jgi:hypothetical protein
MILAHLDQVLEYLFRAMPKGINKDELFREVFANDPSVPIDAILLHLEEKGQIYFVIEIECGFAIDIPNCYGITVSGIVFFQGAYFPNKPYESAELERKGKAEKELVKERTERKEAFLKRNWVMVSLITYFLGVVSPIGSEFLKRKLWPDPKGGVPVMIVHDTIYLPSVKLPLTPDKKALSFKIPHLAKAPESRTTRISSQKRLTAVIILAGCSQINLRSAGKEPSALRMFRSGNHSWRSRKRRTMP